MKSEMFKGLYNCRLKVWVCWCDELQACQLHRCLSVAYMGETAAVYVYEIVCLCVLECSRGTWPMLRTRLRDSVSVALLPPPASDTYWDNQFFVLLYPPFSTISFLQIKHDFLFSQILFVIVLQRYCTCVLLSIDYTLSNCRQYYNPETASQANRRHSGTLSIDLYTSVYELDKFIEY